MGSANGPESVRLSRDVSRKGKSCTPTYVDPATGDTVLYHNFVVTPNGYIYRTRKMTRDNAAETVQKESKRSRNAERAPNQA